VLMGLLLAEIVASSGVGLEDLVEDLLKTVGPAHYTRVDLRLARPISKAQMVEHLSQSAPARIGGAAVESVQTMDGVKYLLSDDSWLLIRPSGTEPVLRVYAEARELEMVEELLGFGQQVAEGSQGSGS